MTRAGRVVAAGAAITAWIAGGSIAAAGCARPAPAPPGAPLTCGGGRAPASRTTPRGVESWCEGDRGVRSGPFERRFPRGGIAERGSYTAGALDGDYQAFYASGAPHMRGRYARGQRVGAWQAWHENGKPWLDIHYAAGVPHGAWRELDYAGVVMFEGTYRDGKLEGAWRAARSGGGGWTGSSVAGRIEGTVAIDGGDGTTGEQGYRDNRLHGTTTFRDKDGKITYSAEYVDGIEQGGDAR